MQCRLWVGGERALRIGRGRAPGWSGWLGPSLQAIQDGYVVAVGNDLDNVSHNGVVGFFGIGYGCGLAVDSFVLDPSDGVFGRFDLAALCGCHTLNVCCCCCQIQSCLDECLTSDVGTSGLFPH